MIDFNFNLANQNRFFDKIVREGKTDQNGDARELLKFLKPITISASCRLLFMPQFLMKPAGPVSRSASADIYTQPVFLGVGYDESWLLSIESNHQVSCYCR